MGRLRELTGRWRDAIEARVLVVALIAFTAIWVVAEVGDEVMEGSTTRFDEWVLVSLRDAANPADAVGPNWFEAAVLSLTALGDVAVLGLITLVVLGYLLLHRLKGLALVVALAIGGGTLVSTLLKHSFARERPSVVPHLVEVSTLSFPSGHSLQSAVTYLTLGALLTQMIRDRRSRIYVIAIAGLLTALVGLSRIYLGVHYPTDVLAGWCTGLAWALAWWIVLWRVHARHVVAPRGDEVDQLAQLPREQEA